MVRPPVAAPAQLRLRQRGPSRPGPHRDRKGHSLADREPRTGLPLWSLILAGVTALILVLTTATGATKWSFAVFVAALVGAAMGAAQLVAQVIEAKQPLRAARAGALIVLAAALPLVFDPHTGDVFNLPKFTVMAIGCLLLLALWLVAMTTRGERPRWANGLQWAVGALVLWTLLSALAGMDTHVSLLGNYGSYDGFYAAGCFGVLFMVAAESLDPEDVRQAISAVFLCAGSAVAVYGLIQLRDTEVHGAAWDFINWHASSFAGQIFSTLGNPNHLGGFLSMALPAVLVLGLGASRTWWRVAAGMLALVIIAEIIRTSARGAWVAVIVSLAVLAVGMAPEVSRRSRLYAGTAAGVVVVVAGAMAAGGSRFLSHKMSTLFQTSTGSSIWQRFQIWGSAVRIAGDHPLTGIGPDNFALVYPRYQSAAWVHSLGPNYLVNGAHDIFMNFLADEGPIGLVLWLAVLVLLARRAVMGWRSLRQQEVGNGDGGAEYRRHRMTLSVLAAAIAAYVVQASFNVQQIGLSELFWVLAGCTYALTVAPSPAGNPAAEITGSPLKRPRSQASTWGPAAVTAGLCLAGVVVLGIFADAPYRADHDYWAAYESVAQARAVGVAGTTSREVSDTFYTDLDHAISLNPAEPTYPLNEAIVDSSIASHATSASQANASLVLARTAAMKAAADEPLSGAYPATAAQINLELARLEGKVPVLVHLYLSSAEKLAHQALADNPRDTAYQSLLAEVGAATRANR
ncbi:MAG TPA: O-antigen ligase family protein [Acidimicrobiales bacterium]|nr:O-antigen ligase family protein [Acidimicrobiales bacterium]